MISLGRLKLAGLASLPLLIFALFYARFAASGRVAAGVVLGGVELGGSSAEQARAALSARSAALGQEKLRLSLSGAEATSSVAELGVELDVAGSVSRALGVARSGGVFANAFRYLRSFAAREQLAAALRVDRARFEASLDRAQAALVSDPPVPAALTIEGTTVVAVAPRAGRKIVRSAALSAVSDAVANGRSGAPLPLTTELVEPPSVAGSLEQAKQLAEGMLSRTLVLEAGARRLELTPAELGPLLQSRVQDGRVELGWETTRLEAWLETKRASLEAEARDARFEVSAADEVRITPSEVGVRLSTDAVGRALWAAAQSDSHRGELPLTFEPQPARSTEQAQRLGVTRLVGAFTTRHPCCQPRVDNIHRVATLLDGLLVEPGQTVSVNAIVGARTQKNGFVLAPSIEDGEMVDTVGGGVSQFATTFFNALFRAGYDIIERKPHTYWFPRYPMGIEATLSWPHPDIVFKNDSQAGLLVKTSFTDKSVTVKLYGDSGGRRVSFDVSDRRDIIQPAVELLPNRAVPPDEEKVKEGGMIGWSVLVSRTVTFADGTKKEEKRKVTYKPKPRRVDVHPCRIPKGEPGASGEPCPELEPKPEPEAEPEAAPQPG